LHLIAMEQLAGLTALRDRDQFDLALAHALAQVFGATAVGLHKVVKDHGGRERWLTLGAWDQGGEQLEDPNWVDVDLLPLLGDFPLRETALHDRVCSQMTQSDEDGGGCVTVVPWVHGDFPNGVVELCTAEPLTALHIKSLETFMQVVRNHQGLLDTAQTDPLTGLLNRQTFDTTFLSATLPSVNEHPPHFSERRKAAGETWWMAVVDIDHFKLVNDRFGHLIGDEVLVLVARLLRQNFRHYDRLYRFGGEEFVAMVRCPNEVGAFKAFERLRISMEAYAFPQVGRVTVSIGFTEVFKSDAPSSAFARADEAVYQAKHQGRNRVLSHEGLLALGVVEIPNHEGGVELF
jgi:diguanylate cyclase (GGDEF)-like protein